MNEGLEEMEAIEMVAASMEEAAAEDTGVSVVILPQVTGSFDARIFSEELQLKMEAELKRAGEQAGLGAVGDASVKPVTVGIFSQIDVNGKPNSVLLGECRSPEWSAFVLTAKFELAGIYWVGNVLDDWLKTVRGVIFHGKKYAANFGPFPFTRRRRRCRSTRASSRCTAP